MNHFHFFNSCSDTQVVLCYYLEPPKHSHVSLAYQWEISAIQLSIFFYVFNVAASVLSSLFSEAKILNTDKEDEIIANQVILSTK